MRLRQSNCLASCLFDGQRPGGPADDPPCRGDMSSTLSASLEPFLGQSRTTGAVPARTRAITHYVIHTLYTKEMLPRHYDPGELR
jgi:hypothetical protein